MKHVFDLKDYVKHHVSRHTDLIGKAIRLRYAAIAENPFLSEEELDAISPSPHSLNTVDIQFEGKVYSQLEAFGIT